MIGKGIASADRVVTTGFARLKTAPAYRCHARGAAAGRAAPKPEARANSGRLFGDMEKHCANVERSRTAIRACLQAKAEHLSEPCKVAMAAAAGGKVRSAT